MNAVQRLMSNVFGADFGASKPAPKPAAKPAAKPATKPAPKPAPKVTPKPVATKPAPAPAPAPKPKPSDVTKKDSKVAMIPAKVTPKGLYVLRKGLNPDNSPPEVVAAIKKLQDALGMKVPANEYGYFGGKTESAVKDFQKKVGFTGKDVDGIVGDATWSKLPVAATPAGKAQATATAAVQAAQKIKETKPKPVTVVTAAPKPAPTPSNPVILVTQQAAKAATQAATKTKDAVVKTHVVIKKQPLWIQVVTVAAAGLGAIAGFHAIREVGRKAF